MGEKLKSCPFCGGVAEIHERVGVCGPSSTYIQCCMVETQSFHGDMPEESTAKAIKAWNQRKETQV